MNGFLRRHRTSVFFAFLFLAVLTAFMSGCNELSTTSGTDARQGAINSNAELASLELSSGVLDPIFQASQGDYTSGQGFLVASIRVIPTAADEGATITVAGAPVASGEASGPIALAAGSDTSIAIEVTASDGVSTRSYTVAVARQAVSEFAEQASVKASNTGAYDAFGISVALSGDTLAVGAPFEDGAPAGIIPGSPDDSQAGDAIDDTGAVYVFVRDGSGNWVQQAYIKGSYVSAGDAFGFSLALSGDTLAVGAFRDNSAATGVSPRVPGEPRAAAPDSGAVYVFTRDGEGVWSQQAYIKASNTGEGDGFGYQLALSGSTLAVGALEERSALTGVHPGSPANAETGDRAPGSGAVYVFSRDGTGNWSQQAYIKASNAGPDDAFGSGIALSGNTLAVGAYGEGSALTGILPGSPTEVETRNALPASGAVYVFSRDGTGNWSQQAYIKASNAGVGNSFGWSVALSGDTLAVGAWLEGSLLTGVLPGSPTRAETGDVESLSGAVYVFSRDGTGNWSQQAYIKASNTGANEAFGETVALWGDTLAVGAMGESSALTGILPGSPTRAETGSALPASGAVYVFSRDGSGNWTQQAYVKASSAHHIDDLFGHGIALSADTLVVGAENESAGSGAPFAGVVHVFF